MDFKQLFDDNRAVSPVIGVILMVAITVILAAVIGTFVLGLGDQVQQTTPQVSFGFDTAENQQKVTITHESGDTLQPSNVQIKASTTFNDTGQGSFSTGTTATWAELTGDSETSAGSSATIGGDGGTSFAGDTIRVVFNSPDSDNTATLGKFEVPN